MAVKAVLLQAVTSKEEPAQLMSSLLDFVTVCALLPSGASPLDKILARFCLKTLRVKNDSFLARLVLVLDWRCTSFHY